ncbi:uncharacterized protein LOC126983104 [Eriocheir sinensis]|uniref:uncharacterized protein LOC126983104 n=1 Tax=Eriocheir sinensis TaxID=95602 RepID=UPI0021C90557|nr:uncharacterized protein LOC126983104 [Eriocheir sinensis]
MGLNCHFMTKPRKHRKRLELEALLDRIQNLEKDGKVETSNELQASIIAEASKQREHYQSRQLEKRQREAAKQLRSKEEIIIRRADKTAAFVIMAKEEYLSKMDSILSDTSKFKKIRRNPTEDMKKKINATCRAINIATKSTRFPKLTGEFSPGYAYGNVKTHKTGNPLRPIISQIPTATYTVAKKLNEILAPYTPMSHALTSTNDFLEILRTAPPADNHIIASLDVESLFTNVPVNRTIQIIMDRVYRCEETEPLDIPEEDLRTLLEICTKEAPFTCPRGDMYCQVDGVAMGSPLGVLFANFFMGTIESMALKDQQLSIYARYVDDIFIRVKNIDELQKLKQQLSNISGLNFTFEESQEGRLPFLDVLVSPQDSGFNTSVYIKPTNTGLCLNGNSECPQRYRRSTINAYIRRAISHSSTWKNLHNELERITQVLVNNGYPNSEVTQAINCALEKWYNPATTSTNQNNINLYYRNYMSITDERVIKDIIHKNVKPTNAEQTISLIIYYKTSKTANLLIKNRQTPPPAPLQEDHVIYEHTCAIEDCGPHTYIGMTRTKLTRRLTCHLQNGAIKNHYTVKHKETLARSHLEDSTKILDKETDPRRLLFLEALYIEDLGPTMNTQAQDLQILPTKKK